MGRAHCTGCEVGCRRLAGNADADVAAVGGAQSVGRRRAWDAGQVRGRRLLPRAGRTRARAAGAAGGSSRLRPAEGAARGSSAAGSGAQSARWAAWDPHHTLATWVPALARPGREAQSPGVAPAPRLLPGGRARARLLSGQGRDGSSMRQPRRRPQGPFAGRRTRAPEARGAVAGVPLRASAGRAACSRQGHPGEALVGDRPSLPPRRALRSLLGDSSVPWQARHRAGCQRSPSRRGRFAGKRKNDRKYELTSASSLRRQSW